MSDDREEFERGRLAEDEEGDTVVTRTLLHRQTYPIPDEGLNEIPAGATHYAYRRLLNGPTVDFWREEPAASPPGPRFGERLRVAVGFEGGYPFVDASTPMEAGELLIRLAAEIDADRDASAAEAFAALQALHDELIATWEVETSNLRRQIEEAVANTVVPVTRRQVLAALAEIFGRDGSS